MNSTLTQTCSLVMKNNESFGSFLRVRGQIPNLPSGSERKNVHGPTYLQRGARRHVRLRSICEFSYLCWCPLWPVWTELLGSGPAEPAGCTAATAGSSAGKTWRPNTATRWEVRAGKTSCRRGGGTEITLVRSSVASDKKGINCCHK